MMGMKGFTVVGGKVTRSEFKVKLIDLVTIRSYQI